jgi:hypothetical protein
MPGIHTDKALRRSAEAGYVGPSKRQDRCAACEHSYVPPREINALRCRHLHRYVASGGRCDEIKSLGGKACQS